MDPTSLMRWYRIGILSALALLLSYAETFVPIPIPGVKLGLANIPMLMALREHDTTAAVSIAWIKVLAQGLLFGSPLTLAYSLAGTTLSLALMAPLSRLKTMRLWMCSIAGAVAHEMGQLAVAALVLKTPSVFYLTPLLSLAGIACGAVSGVLATRLGRAWPDDLTVDPANITLPDATPTRPRTVVLAAFAALAALTVIVFHSDDTTVLAALAAVSLVACLVRRVGTRTLLNTMRLVCAMGVLTLVSQLMVPGVGGPFTSLAATLRLAAIAFAAQAAATTVEEPEVTGTLSWLVSPLGRLGIDTQGLTLATSVALTAVPHIGEIVRRERTARGGLRPRELPSIVEAVVRELAATTRMTPAQDD